jgi:mannose-6-phosphate isomerase-like protein (cupin superfamily)
MKITEFVAPVSKFRSGRGAEESVTEARIVRSGEGEQYGTMYHFKQGSLTGGRFDFMVGEMRYLSGPPLHVHRDQDDTFYVLDGAITLQIGDEIVELKAGDFATVPPGTPHTFDNFRKDQPAKAVNLMTPGGLDALFQDMEMLAAAMRDPKRADELWEKHGVRVVGPPLKDKLGLA